jgi:hypothetical protein
MNSRDQDQGPPVTLKILLVIIVWIIIFSIAIIPLKMPQWVWGMIGMALGLFCTTALYVGLRDFI